MVTPRDYALLSAFVYTALPGLRPPVPDGWETLTLVPDELTGFSAGVFQHIGTNEIVIAYTGTNGVLGPDLIADIASGASFPSLQVLDAIYLYSDVLAAHPGADISF